MVFTALLSSPSATTFVTLFTKDSGPDTTIVSGLNTGVAT